jgi:hypothetical protein
VVARDVLRREQPPPPPGGRGGLRPAAGGRLDLHGHHALVAKPVDDLRFVGGLELARGDVASGVDSLVSVQRHLRPL